MPEQAASPSYASRAIDKIKKSGQYVLLAGVPIFDQHEQYDAQGNLVNRVDRAKLLDIAKKGNDREKRTGDLAPIGLGHTKPLPAPETEQPPIVGYACNYQVTADQDGKPILTTDWWIKKDQIQALDQYPRRSVELWKKRGDIDWIALLKRSPERDLGLMLPDVNETNALPRYLRPKAEGPVVAYERHDRGDHKICYSMERYAMSDKAKYGAETMADPTSMPNADHAAGPDAEYERFAKMCSRYMKEKMPHLPDMHQKYAAALSGTNGALPAAGVPQAGNSPAAPNGELPDIKPAKFGEGEAAAENVAAAKDRERAASESEAYARKNDELARMGRLEAEILSLKKDSEESKQRYQRERCARLVDGVMAAGYFAHPDKTTRDKMRDKIIGELMPMDEKARFQHIDMLRQFSRRDPSAARDFVPTAETGFEGGAAAQVAGPEGDSKWASVEETDQAISYAHDHNLVGADAFDVALRAVRGGSKNGAA